MADSSSDVLMKMVGPSGPILAESRTVFAAGKTLDPLRLGFQAGQFCDLLSFEFALGVEPAASKRSTDLPKTKEELEKYAEQEKARVKRELAMANSGKTMTIDMQPVQFSRIFDMASPPLFDALVKCETLQQVSIIKRKAANTANSGEVYLRLDFTKVLVTDLEWGDKEHYIEESGSFIFRELSVRYRQQKPDGTLGVPIPMQWKMQR